MCLYYASQRVDVLIGSKDGTTRTAVTLPTAYNSTVSKSIATGGFSKLNLDILYTMGASETSNTIDLKIECSPDGENWYRLPNDSTSAGTSTLTAREFTFTGTNADAATISLGLDIFYKYMKISAKEGGVSSTSGTVYIEGTLSGK